MGLDWIGLGWMEQPSWRHRHLFCLSLFNVSSFLLMMLFLGLSFCFFMLFFLGLGICFSSLVFPMLLFLGLSLCIFIFLFVVLILCFCIFSGFLLVVRFR